LGKKLPFSPQYTEWHLKQAKQAGLDAICITEHYNGTQMEETFQYVQGHEDGDSFILQDGLRVFLGLEIDAQEGGHFSVIGALPDIKNIYAHLEPFIQKSIHPKFDEIVSIVKQYPVLFGASHPFRETNKATYLQSSQLSMFDYIELNGKDHALDEHNGHKVAKLAQSVGLPIIAGSDTHQAHQFGCIMTEFHETHTTIQSLRHAIKKDAYTIRHGQHAKKQVETAKLIKSALKEINKLGGDYVSVMLK